MRALIHPLRNQGLGVVWIKDVSDGAQLVFMRLIDDGLADLGRHAQGQIAEFGVDPQLNEVDSLRDLLVDSSPRPGDIGNSLIGASNAAVTTFENYTLTGGVQARHFWLFFVFIGAVNQREIPEHGCGLGCRRDPR
jgi:hypothetical protein